MSDEGKNIQMWLVLWFDGKIRKELKEKIVNSMILNGTEDQGVNNYGVDKKYGDSGGL